MARTGSPPVSVSTVSVTGGGTDPRFTGTGPTVVWLHGEHDAATAALLSQTMIEAIARDDADLVVDLSGVQFMGAATVDVIVAARSSLRRRSRSLVVRAPSRCARRLLDICGLAELVDRAPTARRTSEPIS